MSSDGGGFSNRYKQRQVEQQRSTKISFQTTHKNDQGLADSAENIQHSNQFDQDLLPVIGITGNHSSGKSTIARVLESKGWIHIEVDELGHDALEQKREEILSVFSTDIVDTRTGYIDRKKLGALVFSDAKMLSCLESIVHPFMYQRVQFIIKQGQNKCRTGSLAKGIIVNAAILYRMELDRVCDCVFLIQAPFFLRFIRACQRGSMSVKEVLQRLYIQQSPLSQLPDANADMHRVSNIFLGKAIRRIEGILRAKIWDRTGSTPLF